MKTGRIAGGQGRKVAWQSPFCRTGLLLLAGLGLLLCWPRCGIAATAQSPVVARVYQEAITADMLGPPEEGVAIWRLRFGDELAQLWTREMRRDSLTRQIVGRLIQRFCNEQGITASDADIQGYLVYLRWRIDARRERLTRELEHLAGDNPRPELSEEERNRILTAVEHLAAMVSRLDRELESEASGGEIPHSDDAQHALARSEVLRWKGYRALYAHYGGEVVGDARGLIPIGAVRALVTERRETYGVTLLDPDYQDLLDDFHLPYFGAHFPVSRHQAEAYFAQPWWLQAVKGKGSDPAAAPARTGRTGGTPTPPG